MHQLETNNLGYRMAEEKSSNELAHITHAFNNMAKEIQTLKIEAYEKDIEKLQIEAVNLRLQVTPHMLLNSLNTIYSLSLSGDHENIQKFTLLLADYFRKALRHVNDMATIEEEMWYVKNYMQIQSIHYPDAFCCNYDICTDLLGEKIPALLIQSFVENSVKYGTALGKQINIGVVIQMAGDEMVIRVTDDGNGIEEHLLEVIRSGQPTEDAIGKHIGIWNSRRRLKMIYGDAASIAIESEPGKGTNVMITLPIL
jgi:sensor histidine kinase YesM